MKKLLFATLLLPVLASAQQDSLRPRDGKFIRVVSISAYSGADIYRDGFEDRTIFQQAAPASTLAFADLSAYSNAQGFYYSYGSRTSLSSGINVNLHLRCQQRYSEVRFGLTHSMMNVSSQYYSKDNTTRIASDTLSNGTIYFTDSISNSSYRYSWNSDILQLNLSWIVRTDPKRWLNLYTGFGVFGGVGYNGIVSAQHVHSSYHTTYNSAGTPNMYSDNYETEVLVSEKFRAPSFTSMGAYIPIGFNLRLGRRSDFFRHVTLFGEYNGAVQIVAPKGVDSKIRTASSIYGGVRWYIHAPGGNFKGRHDRREHHDHHNAEDGGQQQPQPKVD